MKAIVSDNGIELSGTLGQYDSAEIDSGDRN